MSKNFTVLITSPIRTCLETLDSGLKELPGITVSSQLRSNNDPDSQPESNQQPDLLIYHLGAQPERELMALAEHPVSTRPILLVIAKERDARQMRLAMQAGARDYIVESEVGDQLQMTVNHFIQAKVRELDAGSGTLTALINAKGGAGASIIAGSLAHIMTTRHNLRTVLLDVDLQFGTQLLNLDLHNEQGLMEALERVASLDDVALTAYTAKHTSGLHLLGTLQNQIILPGDVRAESLNSLINLLRQNYQQLVVDLPRLIDPIMEAVMEKATNIILVIQQYFSHIRDAKRLLKVITDEIGISRDKIKIIVNRYQDRSTIHLSDIKKTLQHEAVYWIPNDYINVNTAMNLAIPLMQHAPKAAVTRAMKHIADDLNGYTDPSRAGWLDGWLQMLQSRD